MSELRISTLIVGALSETGVELSLLPWGFSTLCPFLIDNPFNAAAGAVLGVTGRSITSGRELRRFLKVERGPSDPAGGTSPGRGCQR